MTLCELCLNWNATLNLDLRLPFIVVILTSYFIVCGLELALLKLVILASVGH